MVEYERVLVPIVGKQSDEAAIELACNLARKDTEICLVHVIEITRGSSLDTEVDTEIGRSEDMLSRGKVFASNKGYDAQASLLQARDVASAIVDEATERESNLIVMASQYKRKFGVFSLGSVIPTVLKNSQCPVMLIQT